MPFVIHSGLFNHVLSLENPTKTQQNEGSNKEAFNAFVTTRGFFRKKSGFRNLEEGYDQLVSEYEAYMYWRSDIENNMTKDTRLVYDNRVFKILSYERMEQHRMYYKFLLIEVE